MTEENKKQAVIGFISKILAGLNALGLVISVGYSLYIRGRFMEIMQDLGVALPVLTRFFLTTPGVVWVLSGLLGLVILVGKEFIPRKWVPLVMNVLFLLFGIIYWAVFSTAMLIPLAQVIQQVSAP